MNLDLYENYSGTIYLSFFSDIIEEYSVETILNRKTHLAEEYREAFKEKRNKQYATREEENIIKEIIYKYPKARVCDGVLMLEGLKNDRHDMSMHKEFLTVKITSKLLGQDIILLPRFMDRMLNDIAGYQRFDNYSLSDGISGIASDGRTIEFKMCSPKSVESKASKALSKADIAVIITFTRKGLNKVNTNNIFGKGEVFILNTYTDNGVEFLTKNSPNHWRKICSDSKSQPRYDYSFFDLSLLQELQFVKPDNQDPMDYEVYDSKFNQIVGG